MTLKVVLIPTQRSLRKLLGDSYKEPIKPHVRRRKYNETDEISISNKYLRLAVHEAFGGRCFYTGRDVLFADMHIDHVRPKARGGKDVVTNYALTCREMNYKKRAKQDEEFIAVTTNFIRLVYARKVLAILNKLTRRGDCREQDG